jgi:hypothetical protein
MDFISGWKKKDNFSVPRHQELVDGINVNAILTATGGIEIGAGGGRTVIDSRSPIVEEIFFGYVVTTGPNGESDYADGDPRYFIRRLVPTVGVSSDPITMEDDLSPQAEMTSDNTGGVVVDDIVTATNFQEIDDSSLTLQANQDVTVMTVYAYKDDKLYKLYLVTPGTKGGGVSLLQNGTNVITNTPFINMSSTRGTSNILQFALDTVGGTSGAKLQFNTLGSNRTVLQVGVSGTVIWDYVRFHS